MISLECKAIGNIDQLDSNFKMFGIGKEKNLTETSSFPLYPKDLKGIVFFKNQIVFQKKKKFLNFELYLDGENNQRAGIRIIDKDCFTDLINKFNLIENNDFKDIVVTSSNETLKISMYGSILIE
jgi:hypothetical protein